MFEIDKTNTWGGSVVHKIVFRSESHDEIEGWIRDKNLKQMDRYRWKDDFGNYFMIKEV